jgi:adenine-specific DNA-methyltransferase
MPSRTAPPAVIAPRDLETCLDPAGVLELFRKLRYPVEAAPTPVPLDEGDLPGSLRDGIAARYPLAQVGGARPGEALLSITLFVLKDHAQKSALIRGIAQMWTRRFLGEHLLVFAAQDEGGFEQLTFVNTRRLGEGAEVRIKLHKLIVDRRSPTRHDLDTLNRIAQPPGGLSATQLYAVQCEAFNVERITDAFYREYTLRFRAAQQRIKQENPAIAAFSDPTRLHTFTQRLFGRLMFLYFLQKKGALNGNHQFIKSWYEEAVRREENFYRWVLEPLFFETLNRPRREAQSRFGRVPYLNGGLFAADEDDLVGEVYLADDLFDTRHPNGLLYFLENHNFTIEEDTPLEVEVALDPEMLGKVFENLLEEEERGQSGTFYTPRPVVAFMCREALAAYLTRATGLESERLSWLLDEAETGEPVAGDDGQPHLNTHTLARPLREQLDRTLEQVRVLDPAVGSGAFPLGMLALLVGVRRALYRVAGVSVEQQTPLVEGWKRNFIRDCLYGVDIKREAIEIARLRLWLSLVVDADPFEMEPLPNLDFKLMAGNSLIETFEGVTIYPTRPAVGQTSMSDLTTQPYIQRLHDLHQEYFQPSGSRPAKEIKQEIHQTERAIVEAVLKEQDTNNQDRLKRLLSQLTNVLPTQTHRAEIERLRHEIDATQRALADFRAEATLPFFLYRLHFAEVFEEKDGFDIVIANPPYVRHERIPQETLKALKAAYPAVQHGMADLYVYFYARALQLLHDGGTLAFISSNKFFRAGYGKSLRDLLTSQTQAQLVLDFGDAPVFDATAYPCIVLVSKGKPAPAATYRGLTADNHIDLEKLNTIFESTAQMLPQAQGVQPPASSSGASALVQKLMQMGTPLGRFVNGKMYFGIKTGLNRAFMIDQETRDRLVAEDPHSAKIIKPLLRGRNVGRYAIHPAGQSLIFTRRGIDIKRYPAIERYLSQFREDLQPRRPGQEGRGRKPGNYQWYEIQDSVDYYESFEVPKIIYPDIAPRAEFCFDRSGAYPDATLFCIPTHAIYLTAMLNSSLLDFVLMQISPAIRGGFFRYKNLYMERLPIIEPSLEDQAQLARLVDQLQTLEGQGAEAERLEREVDVIVYRTYGLSAEEISEIEHWHAERRAQFGSDRREQQIVADEEAEA